MNGQYDSSLTPEAMQAIMNTGDNDPEMVLLKQRQARADRLRQMGMGGGMPQGHMAGRVYIPPIGDALVKGLALYQAGQQQPQLDADTARVMGNTNAARGQYASKLIDALRRRGPVMGTPQMALPVEPDQDD